MLVKSDSNPRLYFKDFEFNCETHELYRHGLKIRIRGHPVDILAFLVEHPGEAVTRQVLKERLWPQGTFVDFEHLLNNCINKLRVTLRDDAEAPRYIETLPGVGYRFISPVSSTPPEPSVLLSRRNVSRSETPPGVTGKPGIRIAVLPFKSMGGNVDHFAEGLSVQMMVQLGRTCKQLSLISPMSSPDDGIGSIGEIAQELRADYVLAGTVWPIPPLLRVSAQLIRYVDHCCIWSESYTRPDADIFAVQDEITRKVCLGLRESLRGLQNSVAARETEVSCLR